MRIRDLTHFATAALMHREFDPAVTPFDRRSNLSLYLLTALVVTLLLADVWPSLARWIGGLGWELPTWPKRELYGFRFALIAAVVGGARSLYSSLEGVFDGKVGADIAIAVACIAAILIGEPLVAAEVVVIGLVGECLEAFTFDRTQRALRSLAELFPERTWVLRDGLEVRVFTVDLQIGDHVVVKPGGKIPVDGVVLEGQSSLDTSPMTGESLPRDVGPTDAVLAGSINQFGALTIDAKKVATQTIAGRAMAMTAAALKEKAPLERYADRLARRFLPAVFALALLAFIVNVAFQTGPFRATSRVALYPALAVLVVACPCALVLATPAAIIAALGRLAGTGVLIKSGAALEKLAEVTAFAFDKTGTLTEGKLELGDVIPLWGTSPEELLRIAASAEQQSEHPLAKVIRTAASSRGIAVTTVENFTAHPGAGVSATLDGTAILVGARRLLEDRGIAISPDALDAISRLDATGQSSLFIAKDGAILGAIGARDTIRPEAAGVLGELRDNGFTSLVLLTGDRKAVANALAAGLPLTETHAELLPEGKAERIANGAFAFVGDGINDAPALARAKVGIAIGGTGSDLAIEAGDIIMMGDPLRPLPFLVRLSRETVTIIRQNIIWFGFGVNFVGVLLTGFLWPLFATTPDAYEKAPLVGVLYHQLGSLAVLLNSMRLLAFERKTSHRVRDGYRNFDRWLNTVHLDDLFHAISHNFRAILGTTAVLALVAWLASGLTQIEANEVGVVQRFGAVRADLAPGLNVRWPWPIEAVTKLKPDDIRLVEVGFRRVSDEQVQRLQMAKVEQQKLRRPGLPGVTDRDLSWASAHAEETQRITDESLMITGDGNLVEILATVRYTVSDPRTYLFGTRDPDAVIRSSAEAVFRELAAGQPFLDLLTANRARFEQQALLKINRRILDTTQSSLGVALDGLTLHDLHPPQEVVASYHAVASAIQKRDRLVNEAEAEATRAKRRAGDEALRTVRQAEAEGVRKVAEASANRDAFFAWHIARTELSKTEEAAFAKEIETRIAAGQERVAVTADVQARRAQMLSDRKTLTEFRLTMQAVTAVLAGRDKIFLDAANLPGRRHLLLMDPDSQKLPAWMLRPQTPPEKDP